MPSMIRSQVCTWVLNAHLRQSFQPMQGTLGSRGGDTGSGMGVATRQAAMARQPVGTLGRFRPQVAFLRSHGPVPPRDRGTGLRRQVPHLQKRDLNRRQCQQVARDYRGAAPVQCVEAQSPPRRIPPGLVLRAGPAPPRAATAGIAPSPRECANSASHRARASGKKYRRRYDSCHSVIGVTLLPMEYHWPAKAGKGRTGRDRHDRNRYC